MTVNNPATDGRGKYLSKANIYTLAVPISMTVNVAAASTAVGFGTGKLFDLPEGNIVHLGLVANLSFDFGTDSNIVDSWDGDFSIGTVGTEDVDITDSGEADLLASQELKAGASDKLEPTTRYASAVGLAGTIIDNTAGDLDANINILVDAADITDDSNADCTITGTVYMAIAILGDD